MTRGQSGCCPRNDLAFVGNDGSKYHPDNYKTPIYLHGQRGVARGGHVERVEEGVFGMHRGLGKASWLFDQHSAVARLSFTMPWSEVRAPQTAETVVMNQDRCHRVARADFN